MNLYGVFCAETEFVWRTLHRVIPRTDPWVSSDDLTGACAIGAEFLRIVLRRRGIVSRLVLCSETYDPETDVEHVLVCVGDWYLDPTYEQFSPGTPWLVAPEKHYDVRDVGIGCYPVDELPHDWCQEQHPSRYLHKLIDFLS